MGIQCRCHLMPKRSRFIACQSADGSLFSLGEAVLQTTYLKSTTDFWKSPVETGAVSHHPGYGFPQRENPEFCPFW